MNNVIDIITKKPLHDVPFLAEDAADLMLYLINYKPLERHLTFGEQTIIEDLLRHIETNSDTTLEEVLESKGA